MDTKVCKTCGADKPLDEYYSMTKNSKTRGIYIWYELSCKECVKKRSKKWIEDNEERYKTLIRNRDSKNGDYHRELSKQRRLNGKYIEWSRNNRDKTRKYTFYRSLNKTHEINKFEWEACKTYFNNSCAYCGMSNDEAKIKTNNYLHKEHVDHTGSNGLDNCIPACKICNSSKHIKDMKQWFIQQDFYSKEKYDKIVKWITEDYKKYLDNRYKQKIS